MTVFQCNLITMTEIYNFGHCLQTEPKRKVSLQQSQLKAAQNHTPLTRSVRGVQQWVREKNLVNST